MFLGLAQLELGDAAGSEAVSQCWSFPYSGFSLCSCQTYKEAIASNSTQPLAHQGLAKVYEKGEKWEEYAIALESLASLFRDAFVYVLE